MADDGGKGIPLDIRPPLPARGIRMASPDIFGLETFEFLLVAKLVGHGCDSDAVTKYANGT